LPDQAGFAQPWRRVDSNSPSYPARDRVSSSPLSPRQ
jgi:hypothetical protein